MTRAIAEILRRAAHARTASIALRSHTAAEREAWRVWWARWAELGKQPADERMLAVCMYCRDYQDKAGWRAMPPGLGEVLRHGKGLQITHGACPVCLAEVLAEAPANG